MRVNARKRLLLVKNACFCSKTVADICYLMKMSGYGPEIADAVKYEWWSSKMEANDR